MRVLIDISHPAHVHFYRHLRQRLVSEGADVVVVARDKDVTVELLTQFGIPHLVVGRSGNRGWLRQFTELVRRDLFLVRQGLRNRPDVILTRNPSGVQAGRLLGVKGVFDTDDGRSAGVHYRAAAPFAHVITAPDCLPESLGPRERRYPSYKSLAYLHPEVFTPDPTVRDLLGVGRDRYAVLRLVAHDASHDRASRGIDAGAAQQIVGLLEQSMRVFVTSEGQLPNALADRALSLPATRIHDVLAEAEIVVGDSQTVTTEAALLATPAIRINTWVESSPHLTELEQRYGLAFSFGPDDLEPALRLTRDLVQDPRTSQVWAERRDRMLKDKVSLTNWYVDLVRQLAS
jgi:uncharacterized protein